MLGGFVDKLFGPDIDPLVNDRFQISNFRFRIVPEPYVLEFEIRDLKSEISAKRWEAAHA